MKEVGVVIPYYHDDLTEYERISFMQCMRILGNYSIILVIPNDLKGTDIIAEKELIIERVPKEWLESVVSYNAMMLNVDFYKRFQKYEYILIYQLDAFVLSDKLMEMCSYNYDYIGAPWLEGYFYYRDEDHCIWNVGNGGFSLRRVKSFINLLQNIPILDKNINEDFQFAIANSEKFKVAPMEVALKFSFETEVQKCFELNDYQLPFGCHAWEKYDLHFWKPIIRSYGYEIEDVDNHYYKDHDCIEKYQEQRKIAFFWNNVFSIGWFRDTLTKTFSKKIENYIIWGAGFYGELLCKILREAGLSIKEIIDSNVELIGKEMCGCSIVGNDICLGKNEGIIVAIKRGGVEVINVLNERGYVYKEDYILFNDIIKY